MQKLALSIASLAPFCAIAQTADVGTHQSPTLGAAKPNIIVILADDLGWQEVGCFGQQKIRTPNIDRMAAEGQRWTQFYSGAPVCAPSRNVLLTGRHTGGCNVQDLKRVDGKEKGWDLRGDWPMDAANPLPLALKKAGYTTAAFGKWGMGQYGTTGAPDKNGVDHFYGYTDHRMCHSFYPPFLVRNGENVTLNKNPIPGHFKIPDGPVTYDKLVGEKHASVAITEELLAHVDKLAVSKKPFFIYYCPLEPHVAMQPPKEWVDKYPESWDSEPYRGDKGYVPHPRPHAGYAATISFMDDNIGKLMAKLKEKGLDSNTLVIFTSDNGTTHDVGGVDHKFFNSVGNLRGLKGSNYEGGLRVPTIVRWPGKVSAGKTVNLAGYSADIMPTLCSIVGANAGEPLGENLAPVILGEKQTLPNRKPLVWTGGGYGGQVSVHFADNMKAIRRNLFPGAKKGPLDWEVYDLNADIAEAKDLSATRPDVIERAQELLMREYTPAPDFKKLDIFAPHS